MEKLDKVEKVREKTGVSYEEARMALEQCDYDVLDAIVLLERQGKTQKQSAHHTTDASQVPMSTDMMRAQQAYEKSSRKSRFSEVFERILEQFKKLCARGLEVSFVVFRHDERFLSIPVLLLVILALFLLPAVVPLLIVGLFFGFKYQFEGLKPSSVRVNDVMGKAADAAESFARDVTGDK